MPFIESLIITLVEDKHSAQYIADVFARKEIATVSHILLIPYSVILKDTRTRGSMALVYIREWCDTEVAWNFIRDLNDPTNAVVKTLHDNTYATSWSVSRNPSARLIDNPDYRRFITIFPDNERMNLMNDFDDEMQMPSRRFYSERYGYFALEIKKQEKFFKNEYNRMMLERI